ncbi:hypothetical protein J116_016815 [Streptomyces thermolilacinus SPC6]|uniref:Acyltransferase 3 domain-containing protein n=1 Tax=Streptomyces thermolilacinus SPC6 TaxID=1306406 RepID=A0A1D3DU85_9ACTN|nr:hypothetical protein [Streptomyces thermolilacinus]OEJ95891.1 hypothetical protein J116_016815 [Streptomyces thermolilacinus SPC6]
MPTRTGTRLTARDLAANTPATRDRYIDLLRVASLAVVVLGHWLMAAVTDDGRVGNLLSPSGSCRAGRRTRTRSWPRDDNGPFLRHVTSAAGGEVIVRDTDLRGAPYEPSGTVRPDSA